MAMFIRSNIFADLVIKHVETPRLGVSTCTVFHIVFWAARVGLFYNFLLVVKMLFQTKPVAEFYQKNIMGFILFFIKEITHIVHIVHLPGVVIIASLLDPDKIGR